MDNQLKLLDKGYLYIATGQQYIDEAISSVKSLKKQNTLAHATLITDQDLNIPEFNVIKSMDIGLWGESSWKKGILFKVKGLQASPYKKTFFIDSDTYFCGNCDELFEILDYFDLLISHAPADINIIKVNDIPLHGYTPYNTGVIVFNQTKWVLNFFKKWIEIYSGKFQNFPHDQPAFMEALLFCNLKIYVLHSIYNYRIPFIISTLPAKVKIIHGRHSNYEELSEIINSRLMNRAWIPRENRCIFKDSI